MFRTIGNLNEQHLTPISMFRALIFRSHDRLKLRKMYNCSDCKEATLYSLCRTDWLDSPVSCQKWFLCSWVKLCNLFQGILNISYCSSVLVVSRGRSSHGLHLTSSISWKEFSRLKMTLFYHSNWHHSVCLHSNLLKIPKTIDFDKPSLITIFIFFQITSSQKRFKNLHFTKETVKKKLL